MAVAWERAAQQPQSTCEWRGARSARWRDLGSAGRLTRVLPGRACLCLSVYLPICLSAYPSISPECVSRPATKPKRLSWPRPRKGERRCRTTGCSGTAGVSIADSASRPWVGCAGGSAGGARTSRGEGWLSSTLDSARARSEVRYLLVSGSLISIYRVYFLVLVQSAVLVPLRRSGARAQRTRSRTSCSAALLECCRPLVAS